MSLFRPNLDKILSRFTKVRDELSDFMDSANAELDEIEKKRFALTDEIGRASRVYTKLQDLLK